MTESVQGGKVIFSGLKPSTQYAIEVDMSGFHKLVGNASDVFTTDATTQILAFHAIAGSEDGSVMLNFTVDGNDPDFWNIRYATDGEEERLEIQRVSGKNQKGTLYLLFSKASASPIFAASPFSILEISLSSFTTVSVSLPR